MNIFEFEDKLVMIWEKYWNLEYEL